MRKIEIIFQPDGKRALVEPGTTILDAAKQIAVDLTSICGGKQICGKCKIIVTEKDRVNAITKNELNLLSNKEIENDYRLACSTKVIDRVVVKIPESSRIGKQRLQIEGIETPVTFDPFITKLAVKIAPPSLEDLRSDAKRLLDALKDTYSLTNLHIDFELLKKLPTVLREGNWTATVTIFDNRKIIDVEPGVTYPRNYGIALDIGTTKIAGYLINLDKGKLLSADSIMNPQIPFGEDVISRITHAITEPEGLTQLNEVVIRGINELLESLCAKTGINSNEIYEASVVGNTAMHHLFLNINPKYLALSPYVPVVQGPIDIQSQNVGSGVKLNIHSQGNVHVLPVIAGFVGADHVGVILATEIYKSEEICIAIDIGTNTEIALGNEKDILVCSCASGPAFEGAHIKYGMRAATGAIERIQISPKTFEVNYQTIGNSEPRGICGSAIVDILAELFKIGIINYRGKMNTNIDSPRIRGENKDAEFVIAWNEDTGLEEDISITQEDIRELQLAKAAMFTGATILMKNKGITRDDIQKIFIAGAFGSYIDPKNAVTIGMIPDIPLERITSVGNAAGTGARMVLMSRESRNTANEIARRVRYLELVNDPDFMKEFATAMYIPHMEPERFPTIKTLQ